MSWRPVLLIAGVAAVIHLAVAARYGWHRDEFYYVITGRHLAWGYVDQPPLTPALARLAAALPGGVLPLRILAIAANAGCVLLAARLAAELGGRPRAQLISAAAVAACPAYVGASALFGTTGTDQLCWLAVTVATARALRLGTIPAWLLAGLLAGLGLENKDTIAALLIGIALGLLVTRRAALRTPGPWLAGALAALIALPNILWNASSGWPDVRMAEVLSGRQGSALTQVPELLLLLTGPPLVCLWIVGVRQLCGRAGRSHRWLLVVAITAVAFIAVTSGKSYYAAPALPGLFAAGAARVEAADTSDGRRRWPIAIAATGVFAMVVGLPVLPPKIANSVAIGAGSPVLETYGWSGYVQQIVSVADEYPADTVIFTSNYGEAGALTILGPSEGLHNPVGSGHNAYGYWAPPPGSDATVLCVGEFTPGYLHRFWSRVTEIAPLTMPDGLSNEETQQGAAIYLCQQPRGTWAQLWPGLKHLS
ncbi:glycosyltransferase family 39 protein [Amycolatopsis sp.]|uniref:glycosyltransferase family 39 protein n=1 Tax=Amycolatopsis sp. TaxID=37632 RepID=UPI002C85088B|nr:glycosyltransferase family 39 protein [Amycolatopsis sp.]HVV11755.1 glycosyltransferase family 39 protein [Amycolatopsis sp.]